MRTKFGISKNGLLTLEFIFLEGSLNMEQNLFALKRLVAALSIVFTPSEKDVIDGLQV
jgi:hypothetical protein